MSRARCVNVVLLLIVILLTGCAPVGVRPARTSEQLMELRARHDAELKEKTQALVAGVNERIKARSDAHPNDPLVVDFLVISGGGDWGAFGAGFLKGWCKVQGPLAKPEFDAVTGVSTGA